MRSTIQLYKTKYRPTYLSVYSPMVDNIYTLTFLLSCDKYLNNFTIQTEQWTGMSLFIISKV